MSTILYYFSGTGNSLVVARELAEALGDTKLVSIPQEMREPTNPKADAVGFVFPVYAWGPPRIVADFIGARDFSGSAYMFAVCTCGGFPAGTLELADRMLRAKGNHFSSGFSIVMPGNYTPMYGAIPEAKQQKLFARAHARIAEIAALIKARRIQPLEKNFFPINMLFSFLYRHGMPRFRTADAKFWSTDACTHCGLCVTICPRRDIELKNGRPEWHGNCEQCMACLQWCPAEAIQFGQATRTRKRYRHPAVKAKDFIVMAGKN